MNNFIKKNKIVGRTVLVMIIFGVIFSTILEFVYNETNPIILKSEAEAKEIEPRVKTFQRALFSPATSTVDPVEVTRSLAQDAQDEGVEIHTGTAYQCRNGNEIRTNSGNYEAGYLVNSAGLYSDVIAMQYGFSKRHNSLVLDLCNVI